MRAAALLVAAGAGLLAGCTVLDEEPARGGIAEDEVLVGFRRELSLAALRPVRRGARSILVRALREEADRSQAAALELLGRAGRGPRLRLWLPNAMVLRAGDPLLDALAALPEVESIRPNRVLRRGPRTRSSDRGESGGTYGYVVPWNLSATGVLAVWAAGQQGSDVLVAGLDSGVDAQHPALASRWRSEAGWFDPYGQHAKPADLDGHGTRTMGLMVGGSRAASPFPVGMAPEAKWVAARVWNDAGLASLSAIHQLFQWLLDPDGNPDSDDAPQVVNASWGFDELAGKCFLEFEPDLAALRAAGLAVVFSAGNSGPAGSSSVSPANNPSAFAVGALEPWLAPQASSSRGPSPCGGGGGVFPALVAPGAAIWTTDTTLGGVFPDSYVLVSGTSFAAPQVAGAMALLRGAHPQATVEELEEVLTQSALDLGPAGPDPAFGHGLLRVDAALATLTLRRLQASWVGTARKYP